MKGGTQIMAVLTAKKIREYLGESYQESDEELIKLGVTIYHKLKTLQAFV